MLGTARRDVGHYRALDRVKEWTRERFKLPGEAVIMVTEIGCAVPGCPPLETVVVFWTEDATRHHFKVFKTVEEVVEGDLPYAWLMKSLAVSDGYDCDCC